MDRTGSVNDEAYSYLDNGNRNTANGQTYAIDTDNQIQSDGVNDYIYDAEGNRTSKENISTHEREEYTYDYRNRLESVTFKDGGGNVVKVVQNSYDLFNQWVAKNLDPDGPGGAAATDQFFIQNGGNIVLAFDGSAATDVSNRFLWSASGPVGLDPMILTDEKVSTTASPGSNDWTLTDLFGSVTDIANYFTGGGGATSVLGHAAYDWLGSQTSSGSNSLIGFFGKPFDNDTSLSGTSGGTGTSGEWYVSSLGGGTSSTNFLNVVAQSTPAPNGIPFYNAPSTTYIQAPGGSGQPTEPTATPLAEGGPVEVPPQLQNLLPASQQRVANFTLFGGHAGTFMGYTLGKQVVPGILNELKTFYKNGLGRDRFTIVACFGATCRDRQAELFGEDSDIPGRARAGGILQYKTAPKYLLNEFFNAQQAAQQYIKDGKADIVVITVSLDEDFRSLLTTGSPLNKPALSFTITPDERRLASLQPSTSGKFQTIFARDGVVIPPGLLTPVRSSPPAPNTPAP